MNQYQKKIQDTVANYAGRTIQRIDASSCNMWTIYFTDGTFLSMETECFAPGLYGIVPNVKDQVITGR